MTRTRGLKLIVVGIDHGGDKRINELAPWPHPKHSTEEGAAYMRFVVEVVKSYIDANYRTQKTREHTGIIGSSFGGLISHFALCEYSQTFGRVGVLSPSYWFSEEVYRFTRNCKVSADTRVWLSMGALEGGTAIADVERMAPLVHGAVGRTGLRVEIFPAAQHNEAAWRRQFPGAVGWLFASPSRGHGEAERAQEVPGGACLTRLPTRTDSALCAESPNC